MRSCPLYRRSKPARGRPTSLKALALSCAILCVPASLEGQAQPRTDRPSPPPAQLGEFIDDYGIRYVVTERLWLQGAEARYEITEWNGERRFLIARNGAENPTEAGLWTRVDWVALESGTDFEWAFCYAVFDAESQEAARAGAASDRDTPRTGCNGFPFSRMRRVTGLGTGLEPIPLRHTSSASPPNS